MTRSLKYLPSWGRPSTLAAPSSLRTEVCPPTLRQSPHSAWRRAIFWLLAPAPQMLEKLTGVPTVATLPMWWQHGLPEEDGVIHARPEVQGVVARTIAVVATPRISNLDEFQPLNQLPDVRLKWARGPADLAGADWVILPGSKHTSSDQTMRWTRISIADTPRSACQYSGRIPQIT